MKFICSECKGDNIQIKMWVNPNTFEIIDSNCDGDNSDNWCEDCEDHVSFDEVED